VSGPVIVAVFAVGVAATLVGLVILDEHHADTRTGALALAAAVGGLAVVLLAVLIQWRSQ
jgi:uncharacterized membrane protein